MFSKKAAKIEKIFTVDLTVTTYCQIDGEDFVNFCGLLRKHELYEITKISIKNAMLRSLFWVKFVFSKKATKFDKIFTVNLTLCTMCQIDGEDFVKFCGLFRKLELYQRLQQFENIETNT